jgi:AcrR family transcriptional regulator
MAVLVTRRRGPMRPDSRNVVRGQETRRRILVAARAKILHAGFEDLRIDDLAQDVGITKSAVIKSVGGKASILLALGEEDRQSRLELIRQAMKLRTGLKRRLADLVRSTFEFDLARLNLVMAYIGYMWFWTEADHAQAQAMIDDTRALLCELIENASAKRLSTEQSRLLSLRVVGAYVIGLRDLRYGRSSLDESVRLVVEYTLD